LLDLHHFKKGNERSMALLEKAAQILDRELISDPHSAELNCRRAQVFGVVFNVWLLPNSCENCAPRRALFVDQIVGCAGAAVYVGANRLSGT
jgi:hypothetical protein